MREDIMGRTANSHWVSLETTIAQRRAKPVAEFLCLAGLLGLWLAVCLPRLGGPIDLRWDASTYYVLGTALAEGKGYKLINEPGDITAVQYPPALPVLVALHQWYLGTNDYFVVGSKLRLTYFFLAGAYIIAAYALARRWLSRLPSFLVAAIIAVSFYSFLHVSDTLYTELPFALTSTCFLLCRGQRPYLTFGMLRGALASLAYLLRSAGIAILIAWTAESFIQRRYLQGAIRALVAAILILGWQGSVAKVTSSSEFAKPAYSYQRAAYNYANVTYIQNSSLLDPFRPELGVATPSAVLDRIGRNVLRIPLALGESVWLDRRFDAVIFGMLEVPWSLRSYLAWSFRVCIVSAGVCMLFGAVCMAIRRDWFLPLYFTITAGLVALAPWPSQYVRYLAPLAPVTLVFFVVAVTTIMMFLTVRQEHQRLAATLVSVILSGMLMMSGLVAGWLLTNRLLPVSYYDAKGQERLLRLLTYDPAWHALDRAYEWLRVNGHEGAIVAGSAPHVMYLRSGHKTVLTPFEPDTERAMNLLDEVPVTYLVADELGLPGISERYATPLIAGHLKDWNVVFSLGNTKIYERVRSE